MAQLIIYDVVENKDIPKRLEVYCVFLMLYSIPAVAIVLFGSFNNLDQIV